MRRDRIVTASRSTKGERRTTVSVDHGPDPTVVAVRHGASGPALVVELRPDGSFTVRFEHVAGSASLVVGIMRDDHLEIHKAAEAVCRSTSTDDYDRPGLMPRRAEIRGRRRDVWEDRHGEPDEVGRTDIFDDEYPPRR